MPETAADRTERMLSILPWIAASPGVRVTDLAERFGVDRDTLVADLKMVFVEVGVAPFSPDTLVDVLFDEDDEVVEVRLGDYFRRPLRLTHDEALHLLASAGAVQAGPTPNEVLDRAVAKLTAALGLGDAVAVALGDADPELLQRLDAAVTDGRRVRMDYTSFGRDDHSTREVDPWRLVPVEGHWYLHAWCHSAGAARLFRVDRISAATVTDVETSTTPGPWSPEHPFDLGDGRPVQLLLDPEDVWVTEQYPTVEVEHRADGTIRVVLTVAEPAWLERLLLRLGPGVVVTDADSGASLASVAAGAAARVLARYR